MRTLRRRPVRSVVSALVLLLTALGTAEAHDGPPFPIVSDQPAGQYLVSIWTDPDTTDDGTPGGQFWVMLRRADGEPPPRATQSSLVVRPLDRDGPVREAAAVPVDDDVRRQFATVVLDHEGRFAVQVTVDGPLGPASVSGEVDATYDTRPPPIMLVIYLIPFVLVGLLWLRLLRHRRRGAPSTGT